MKIVSNPESAGLETYVIQHGKEDAPRLNRIAEALAPSTTALLDRFEPLRGRTIVDAACGGGDVTIELARRVEAEGQVYGLDADTGKLEAAADRARDSGLGNCTFIKTDLTRKWPVEAVDLIYARFILTHLTEPEIFLAHARKALKPGGVIVVEDVDVDGIFWHPTSKAMEQLRNFYKTVTLGRGCDPFIGRRLDELLETGGFSSVRTGLVQPYGRSGPAKDAVIMSCHATSASVLAAELATEAELKSLLDEVDAYAARADTIIGMPRVFQAWGVK
ncbi:MAG: class I SAM-dependent methyltransferase [Aestuariivirga sp.]